MVLELTAARVGQLEENLRIADFIESHACVFDLGPGEDALGSLARIVDERTFFEWDESSPKNLKAPGFLEQLYRFVRIADARELDDDPVVAFDLNHRLRHTEGVDAVFDDLLHRFHRAFRYLLTGNRIGLKNDVQAALKV